MPRWLIPAVALILLAPGAAHGQQTQTGATATPAAKDAPQFDVILRGGTIYDGTGNRPGIGDVALTGDRIAAVGDLGTARAKREIDVRGLAVAPGFINMLSWATVSLLQDGHSQSDIRQGVTLEVFGEGWSMGPLNARMKKDMADGQADIKYQIPWTTLGEYLEYLVGRGVSCNVASFVGATTIRIHVLGYENRAPSPVELEQMRGLVRQAMEEGALGVGSSLIYAPAFYANTAELIELCKVAAEYQGMYISHMRSEGNKLLEAIDELIGIARQARLPAEIYHLKAAGRDNWAKRPRAIEMIEAARAAGTRITADMYVYTAGSTGLNGAIPPWVQEGGLQQWIARMRDPQTRARVAAEMRTPSDQWENLLLAAGSPDRVLLLGFKNPALKNLTGKTLAEVATRRQSTPEETAMDLVIEDESRVDTVYFMMDEEDVKRNIAAPVGQLRLRRAVGSARGAVPAGQYAPAHLWQRRASVGQVRPRRKGDSAGRGDSQADFAAGRKPGPARSRPVAAELLCRRRRLRSGQDRRSRHLPRVAPVRDRHAARVRQRHAGPGRRRAHRRYARPGRLGPRPKRELIGPL